MPDEHLRQCEDCQANARIIAALRLLYARVSSPPGWEEEVLAEIDALAQGNDEPTGPRSGPRLRRGLDQDGS